MFGVHGVLSEKGCARILEWLELKTDWARVRSDWARVRSWDCLDLGVIGVRFGKDRTDAAVRARVWIKVWANGNMKRGLGLRLGLGLALGVGLGSGLDYSACRSPRTIDSSTEGGYSAVRDNSRSG
eukprot:1323866-Amorphochlora_amoeboformis.AAC.1